MLLKPPNPCTSPCRTFLSTRFSSYHRVLGHADSPQRSRPAELARQSPHFTASRWAKRAVIDFITRVVSGGTAREPRQRLRRDRQRHDHIEWSRIGTLGRYLVRRGGPLPDWQRHIQHRCPAEHQRQQRLRRCRQYDNKRSHGNLYWNLHQGVVQK